MIRVPVGQIVKGCAVSSVLLLAGCTRDWRSQPVSMWNESRYKPMEPTNFFNNGSSARPLVPGTVARGQLRTNDVMYTGRSAGRLVNTFPFTMTNRDLKRGQERFNVYCSPCHARTGDGTGMIVQRGFAKPPNYHIARLRNAPVGHFYDVMTNGYGVMYSYASRVAPEDRWRIAAYIRILQRSSPEVPPEDRTRRGAPSGGNVSGGLPPGAAPAGGSTAGGTTAGPAPSGGMTTTGVPANGTNPGGAGPGVGR